MRVPNRHFKFNTADTFIRSSKFTPLRRSRQTSFASGCDTLRRALYQLCIFWPGMYNLNLIVKIPDKPQLRNIRYTYIIYIVSP